jgi:carnitine-CoA ligase
MGRRTVVDVLESRAVEHPDRAAIIDASGTISYAELYDRSLRVAGGLRLLGVEAGDRVLLFLDNSIDHALAWFGCSCLNALEVPVNTASMPPQLAYIAAHCEARVAVIEARYLDRLRPMLGGLPALTTLVVRGDPTAAADLCPTVVGFDALRDADPVPPVRPAPSDPLGILYTSGTTGTPKGVVVTQAQTYGRMWPGQQAAPQADDITLVVLPIYHVIGQCRGLYNTLIVGGTAVLEARFSASRFWDVCRRHKITYVPLVGVMAQYLLARPAHPDDAVNPVRHVSLGTTIADVESFRRRFGIEEMTVSYGMTEVGGVLVGRAEATGCGYLRPDYEGQLVDDADRPVGPGEVGELVLRPREPWTVMSGYYKQPQETVEKWRNLWLHTGDLMRQRDDGMYMFVSRNSDRIRVRGENVSPGDVEEQLAGHHAVAECAVVGVAGDGPAGQGDQEILAVVVGRPDCPVTPEDLLTHLAPRLPRFALPRYVAFVDRLPRTDSTRRVQRSLLAERALPGAWDRMAIEGTRR